MIPLGNLRFPLYFFYCGFQGVTSNFSLGKPLDSKGSPAIEAWDLSHSMETPLKFVGKFWFPYSFPCVPHEGKSLFCTQ